MPTIPEIPRLRDPRDPTDTRQKPRPPAQITPEGITIFLACGRPCLLSLEDADLAEKLWYRNHGNYAMRHERNGAIRRIRMHRVVLERMLGRALLPEEVPDHRNGNSLDNRRENLRVATRQQNRMNMGWYSNNTAGYRGIHRNSKTGKWKARISINGRRIHLGTFATPEEAGRAYEQAGQKLLGEWFRPLLTDK